MSTYKVADGHSVPAESLVTVDPQPRSEGIRCARRSYGAAGSVYDEGRYIELVFSMLPDAATYRSVLQQFGVQATLTNAVTVLVRDETFSWVRMNGTAVRPEPGRDVRWREFFPRDVVILVRDLEAAS